MTIPMDFLDWQGIFQPFLIFMVLIILMLIMIIVYAKARIFIGIFVLWVFSMGIGFSAMGFNELPFNPEFPILFILFQTSFFIVTLYKVIKR